MYQGSEGNTCLYVGAVLQSDGTSSGESGSKFKGDCRVRKLKGK